MVWSTTIEKYVQGTPLLTQGGKLLVRSRLSAKVGDQYGHLQAIDSDTGATVWRSRIDGGYLVSDDPPLISGDRAYVTSEASAPDMTHFYIIDVRNGTIIKHDLLPRVRPPFAERQGILYFGSARPASYRVSTGEMLWQMYLYGPEGLGPPVIANGVLDPIREEIYLGDWERHLYVLSAKTGEIKDKLNIRSYWRGDVLFNPVKAFFASYGVKRLELNQGLFLVGTVDSSLFVFRRTEKN
jgi:outer membrane protein assembly factor BamB